MINERNWNSREKHFKRSSPLWITLPNIIITNKSLQIMKLKFKRCDCEKSKVKLICRQITIWKIWSEIKFLWFVYVFQSLPFYIIVSLFEMIFFLFQQRNLVFFYFIMSQVFLTFQILKNKTDSYNFCKRNSPLKHLAHCQAVVSKFLSLPDGINVQISPGNQASWTSLPKLVRNLLFSEV